MQKESLLTLMPKLILVVVLIVGVGAMFGMLGYSLTMPNSEVVVSNEIEKEEIEDEEMADWKTYGNEGYGFEIGCPSDWSISPTNLWLGKTLVISKYADRMAVKITLSDDGEIGYFGYMEDTNFIETASKDIVIEGIKGTIYNYKIDGCGDDNKMENDTGYLCYHSKRIKLFANNIYYVFDTSYMGSDGLKITDSIIETIKFSKIPEKTIFKDQKTGITFDYPGYWGNYYIEEGSMVDFEKNRGITYSFQNNSDVHVALENKTFKLKNQSGLYYNYLLDGLPISFEEVTDIDNYCDKNKNESLSCKKYDINQTKSGILEDRVFCVGSPTGGGVHCGSYRFFFIATNNKEFPVLIINMRLRGYNDSMNTKCSYELYQNLDLTKECFKEKYTEYFNQHKKELNEFDQILSTFKFIKK